jgi:hypothetical protein
MHHGHYSNAPMKRNIQHLMKKSVGKRKKISSFFVVFNNRLYIYSRLIWEDNVAIIRKHNLEADLGLHTYTLGMNKYGDMVCFQ